MLRRWWGWLLFLLAFTIGVALFLWLRLTRRTADATELSTKLVETWHGTMAEAKKADLAKLDNKDKANSDKISRLKLGISTHRAAIKQNYVDSGLTAKEITERFKRLKL